MEVGEIEETQPRAAKDVGQMGKIGELFINNRQLSATSANITRALLSELITITVPLRFP